MTTSKTAAFWAHPDQKDIAPGDIFPGVPFSISAYPTRLVRKYQQNLPPKHAQNLQQIFEYPRETADIRPPVTLTVPGGDTAVTTARLQMGMFLTYGSEVDSDLLVIAQKGKAGGKLWLAAPVLRLADLPDRPNSAADGRSMRQIVQANESGHTFYLPPFPSDTTDHLGYYVEFRRICPVGAQFFLDAKANRIATLMPQSKNAMYQQFMWFWTRFELFFHPLKCQQCGATVNLDVRIEGQNVDVDPWE
jgi:hypothetical protein